jgi:hypothetical protein
MANQEILLLAKRLGLLRSKLDELYERSKTSSKRKKLQERYDELDRQQMRLISIVVKDNGNEYDAATAALGKANTALKSVIDGEAEFIKGIDAAAEALDLVSKVIAVV